MIDLLKIEVVLGGSFRTLLRGSDPKTEGTHRYKAGDTVQGKDGREYYVILRLWRRFRWAPLTPCYLLECNGPKGTVADDYEFW